MAPGSLERKVARKSMNRPTSWRYERRVCSETPRSSRRFRSKAIRSSTSTASAFLKNMPPTMGTSSEK